MMVKEIKRKFLPAKHADSTRQKIQTSQLLNRLQNYVMGKGPEMSPAQVNAALGILRKALPDMQAIEQKTEVELKTILTEPVMKESAWTERFTDETPDDKELN